jgi:hypothetical protein
MVVERGVKAQPVIVLNVGAEKLEIFSVKGY